MTAKKAYKILKDTPIRAKGNHTEYSKALHLAMAALEKQIPKEGKFEYASSYTDDPPVMICPCCKNSHPSEASSLYKYCFYCGQALDWGDDN